ncbi:peptidylprolyl isomerase [Aequorivita vladivostokensis]|uniref:Peptidylprolyl isomerase n=1 Tax=Aequorivita vladivostokensis TaxID=171194 RepID=A0ABR5DGK4_9FLAO|nr:peptidylprolyl isomerase [Aequorivita vladivostokensis]KJJ37912.1 peptidylprolyl isomerase [Aequorivita vladivostokensis]MAB56533.1 peptidylprolyl isomerase [Aequorivita sp.]MBF32357.1 peptidylprolyl isomerase [Aequorivita sp.]|tara:strand:- start:16108 stop:18219 length:2112 start_codon:yes stop_codon:yes gene_type:complete
MAILNSIRKRGIFLILIIALALFAFILSDVLTKGGGTKVQDTIATINGTDISRQSFMEEVEATQRNMGPNSNTSQAMNMVWDRELRRVILEEQYEKAGLSVEKAQLDDALKSSLANNPTFLNEAGQVDDGKIQEYIASIKASSPEMYQQWINFEQNAAQGVLQRTYFNMIKGGLRTTVAEGEQEYHFQNDNLNFSYVLIPYSKIADADIKITDDEIKKYIAAHPNDYEVDAQADIQYVFFSEEPSEADIAEAQTETSALLNSKVEFNQDTKSNDTIPGFSNTKDYEEYVNANSDVPYFDSWMFKSQLPPTVADTLINLNEGDIYGPFKVDNAFYLTKVLETKRMPDSADSKHILIRYAGTMRAPETITRTKEEAQKLADSLLGVVKKDKTKFAELASEFSDDGSSQNGGDLGTSTPGRMVPPFDKFIFNNPTGTIGLVETDFGFHVVEVGKQSEPKKAIRLATVVKNIEPSKKTTDDVFFRASKFEVAVKDGDFSELAKSQNLEVKPVNNLGKMEANIPGLGANRPIVNWAFNEDTKVGDIKRFSVPEGYVIAQLTRKNEKGLMSVAQASPTVKPILLNEKKAEKIRESIKGNTLEEIAQNQNVSVQNVTGVTMANPMIAGSLEPKVVGAAFGTKPGESTGLINGRNGVYKVKVTAFNPAPKMESYVNYANQLSTKNAPASQSAVYNALKKKAEIEDNRATFY